MARPKGSGKTEEQRTSLRRAYIELAKAKPWLVKEAFERGLRSTRPLGFLELAARLMKEIGTQESSSPQVAIVFNSPLDSSKLREGSSTIRIFQAPAPKMLDETELLEGDTNQ